MGDRPQGSEGHLERLVRAMLAPGARDSADALGAWFQAEHPVVFRLCLGFLADHAEAEDAAQDAMLHLNDNLERWDRSRPYRAWRNTVVLNLCRDRRRRALARGRAEGAVIAREGAHVPDPALAAERNEARELLSEALVLLSPREREAFVLRDLEGLSTTEVAESMGILQATVRSLITLARRRLRECLGPRLCLESEQERHG